MLAEYLINQEQGLRFIRHAAAAYALSGAQGGPGLVAALSNETADWTFAHFLDSYRGEVNIGHLERVNGIPPLVNLATAVLCKYFTPPGASPTPAALFSAIDSMDFTGDSGVAESVNALQIHMGKAKGDG